MSNLRAYFSLGFRPFFSLGTLWSLVAMGLWMQHYSMQTPIGSAKIPAMLWHAHSMIYGYGMAIIAGFLLTAVIKWTKHPTATPQLLALLSFSWVFARVASLFASEAAFPVSASADLFFQSLAFVAIAHPICAVKQWRQASVLLVLFVLILGNACYYIGVVDGDLLVARTGLYIGLYTTIILITIIGARILPFFIGRATQADMQHSWLTPLHRIDRLLLAIFIFTQLFWPYTVAACIINCALLCVHSAKLYCWHTKKLWQHPMLWVLYLAYGWLVLGFALCACAALGHISLYVAWHAFAVGGFGMMTFGMIARVTLGHTGRSVYQPPAGMGILFGLLCGSAMIRVFTPLVWPQYTVESVQLAQALWIIAFAGLLVRYLRYWITPSASETG